MDDDAAALAATIGQRVAERRRARGWTLDRLAEAAGVSRRMLVNVEQGSSNPSVGTLLRIGDALGVGLPALVEPEAAGRVTLTRAGGGAVLWTGEHGGTGTLVAGAGHPDVIELWDWTLEPGDVHASEAHAPGTRELVHVRTGSLVLEAGGGTHLLGPGDAASFPGDAPHAYRSDHPSTTRFSLAVLEPGVGSSSSRSESRRAR